MMEDMAYAECVFKITSDGSKFGLLLEPPKTAENP